MPHFIAEYSANLGEQADLAGLFEKVHTCLADSGVFPLAGIRSRAIRMDAFRVADGKHNYGFVHMTLKVGAGRDLETRKVVADAVFEIIKEHFAELQSHHLLALSFEMVELNAELNYKHNNIHTFLKSQAV